MVADCIRYGFYIIINFIGGIDYLRKIVHIWKTKGAQELTLEAHLYLQKTVSDSSSCIFTRWGDLTSIIIIIFIKFIA